jgi:hypothetical protein
LNYRTGQHLRVVRMPAALRPCGPAAIPPSAPGARRAATVGQLRRPGSTPPVRQAGTSPTGPRSAPARSNGRRTAPRGRPAGHLGLARAPGATGSGAAEAVGGSSGRKQRAVAGEFLLQHGDRRRHVRGSSRHASVSATRRSRPGRSGTSLSIKLSSCSLEASES